MLRRLLLLLTFLTLFKRTYTLRNDKLIARFQAEVVPNEYIVNYRNYYWPPARKKFLAAAFEKANISYINWNIAQRQNPAKDFPSDFDLLLATNLNVQQLSKLGQHPAIKKISSHLTVKRQLKYVDNALNDTINENFMGRHLLRSLPRQIYEAVGAGKSSNILQ